MSLKFSDLKYKRPDFEQLSLACLELRKVSSKNKVQLDKIRELFENFSEQYLNYISMENLCLILYGKDRDSHFFKKENAFFKKNSSKIQAIYYSVFSALADLNINFDEDSLEQSSILNQARRIARTYGKIKPELLQKEKKLIENNDQIMDNISVEIETVNPRSFASSQLRQKQKYKVFLHEFDKWLKYGNGKARSQLYYKFSQKLQNLSDDVTDNFQKLVENRKEQSQQSNLSYYNFVTDRNKGYGYQRKKILKFKKDLIKYFLPITNEIRKLRNDRLEYSNPLFYNEFKISHKNQLSLLKEDVSIPKATLKTMHNIFGTEDTYIKDIISGGFWSVDVDLQRSLQANVLLLPNWNSLFLLLGFEEDILVLEDGFFCIGKALSDLSGMINLKGLATYEQSNLVQTLTGLAIQFLSMREIELFVGKNAKLYNDLSLTYELLRIPKAIAVDTFESTIYSSDNLSGLSYAELWKQIEQNYSLDFNYGADGYFSVGHAWQLFSDLYHKPFTSLERTMALIIILAERPHRDRRNALETKLNKLLISNTDLPFLKRLEICGFASPFELDTIRRASFTACDILNL